MKTLLAGAKKNDAAALTALGLRHIHGDEVEQSDVEAVRLFERAVALGHTHAMACLAQLCEEGRGTPKDLRRALDLLLQARGLGYTYADAAIRSLEEQLAGSGPPVATEFSVKAQIAGIAPLAEYVGLPRSAATKIRRVLRPSVGLRLGKGKAAVGRTRIGGAPDLPASVQWPCNDRGPLPFLAQLELADFKAVEPRLPKRGHLWFFLDVDEEPFQLDYQNYRVVYSGVPNAKLVRSRAPAALKKRGRVFPARACTAEQELDMPSPASPAVPKLDLEKYSDLCGLFANGFTDRGLKHRVGGHPRFGQEDPRFTLEEWTRGRRPRSGKALNRWVLLLELDSNEDQDMYFGAGGRYSFWIHEADLAAGAFESALVTFED